MTLANELHEVYGSPHIRQVLAVEHMWDPIEAAKWSRQLAVNYVKLPPPDASGTFGRVKSKIT